MRLRNIPGAEEAILNSEYCIKNPEEQKGHWQDCFDKVQPLHIEIGMGKGRFIMDMAALHPDINYIGIERYSSVLLRALQKMELNPLPNIKFICMDATDRRSLSKCGLPRLWQTLLQYRRHPYR